MQVSDDHLPFNAFADALDGYASQLQGWGAPFKVETCSMAIYLVALDASRPEPPPAYSGWTLKTPNCRSSPSRLAAIIHRKLIAPPGAATLG
ncbi:MAG: hypothetical protein AABN33_28905 [Acidobacteriota bacterium]